MGNKGRYKGNASRSQWERTMSPAQREATGVVLELFRERSTGSYRAGVSVYYYPSTGKPTYIEVRLRNSNSALIRSWVVWSEARRPLDLLGVIPQGFGHPDLSKVAE